MNGSLWTNNTSDAIIFSLEMMFFRTVLREQQRLEVSIATDGIDNKYSQTVFKTTIDACRISKGLQTNIFTRMVLPDFIKKTSSDIAYACPYPKDVWIRRFNCSVTDQLLPPMLIEKRFKFHSRLYGMFQGIRSWTFIYEVTAYGRYKK